MELNDENNQLLRAHCLTQLGYIANCRSVEMMEKKQPEKERHNHINDALRFYKQALEILPSNAVDDQATINFLLGNIYLNAGDFESARSHYDESIRYDEVQDNLQGAAKSRLGIAGIFLMKGRFTYALEYAKAALRNCETYGEGAAENIQET
jgi:tetratricopeptide (TPR) repeat protein